jgi:hypothetical protein
MGGAPEAAARGGARAEGLIPGQAKMAGRKVPGGDKGSSGAEAEEACLTLRQGRKAGSKASGAGKNRTGARADELPQEARDVIDRMLAEGGCTYQRIVDELEKMGFTIAKGAVGRREARKAADERMEKLLDRQFAALNRWMEKQSGFDAAGAALAMVIGKLGRRIGDGGDMFQDMPADKAAAGLIQAARAAVQYEKTAGVRKKLRAEARAEAVQELREALRRAPEVWDKIEELIAEDAR